MVEHKECRFMSPREIAETLGISTPKAYEFIMRELPYIRCGRLYKVKTDAFEAWLKKAERQNARG